MRWRWSSIGPPAAVAVLAAASVWPLQPALLGLCVAALIVAVFTAVHHAEVVAHKLGEPFGTLVLALALALAVTVIEVALIVSLMLVGGPDAAVLPRDTLFATVMIICNGVIGICVLVGALRHHEQSFRAEGKGDWFVDCNPRWNGDGMSSNRKVPKNPSSASNSRRFRRAC